MSDNKETKQAPAVEAGARDERLEALRDKWKIVDGDCREGAGGLITYHIDAFDEGYRAALARASEAAAGEPVGKIVAFGSPDLKEVAWTNGKMPDAGTNLYAAPQPASEQQAANSDAPLFDPIVAAASAVVLHWDEFGHAYGFGESMDRLRSALAAKGTTAPTMSEGAIYLVRAVRDTFKRDMEQGFFTKDKEFAVTLLSQALAEIERIDRAAAKGESDVG